MKFCLLASGSKGNSIWFESEGRAILIDNGLSAKALMERIESAKLNCSNLKAIVVSHEHADHTRGIGPLARKLNLPVWANKQTIAAAGKLLEKVELKIFETGEELNFGSISMQTISLPHDGADTVAFLIRSSRGNVGLATDLGQATHQLSEKFKDLDALIMESNHDYQMLMSGPYPWPLKQRINSRHGHLSNEDSANFIASIWKPKLKNIILAHMSESNNTSELAIKCLLDKLGSDGGSNLEVALQHKVSTVIKL